MENNVHILLIDCPDEKGLIYKVTDTIYSNQLNIIKNDEFVEQKKKHFYMRTKFSGAFDEAQLIYDLRNVLPSPANLRLSTNQKKDIVILATKEHHCLGDLLLRHHFGELNANIKAVISNYELLKPFTNKFDIPFHTISHEGKTREQHEVEILKLIGEYKPEYLVLAKYMRILNPGFVAHYPNKIINIHHSFLPAFIGANPYKQAYDRGVKIIGATAHFVNDNLDEGPILEQDVIRVDHTQNAKEIAKAGREVERNVLARSLQLVFQDKVFVNGNKTVILE